LIRSAAVSFLIGSATVSSWFREQLSVFNRQNSCQFLDPQCSCQFLIERTAVSFWSAEQLSVFDRQSSCEFLIGRAAASFSIGSAAASFSIGSAAASFSIGRAAASFSIDSAAASFYEDAVLWCLSCARHTASIVTVTREEPAVTDKWSADVLVSVADLLAAWQYQNVTEISWRKESVL
jgi:hypothetical protein